MKKRRKLFVTKSISFLLAGIILLAPFLTLQAEAADGSYIKWVDFTVTATALSDAMDADIASHANGGSVSWIDLLAALGQKYGGNFSHYQKKDLNGFIDAANAGTLEKCIQNEKLFRYYREAYGAVLGGLVGYYREEIQDENGNVSATEKYGLKAFHPLAAGYTYSHADDFGNERSYGYKRRHLGHDMFGAIGTPVIAMESGYVEALGWNQYGGWRIGIRSLDGKRYYYYAHLRKDHPYADLYEGKIVSAGEVIGYLGMTGYSAKENTNNIQKPHLHVGIELIFDPSQKDGYSQIWISMYELINFLSKRRVRTYPKDGEAISRIRVIDQEMPD